LETDTHHAGSQNAWPQDDRPISPAKNLTPNSYPGSRTKNLVASPLAAGEAPRHDRTADPQTLGFSHFGTDSVPFRESIPRFFLLPDCLASAADV
jgi:hypothetical protein